ncbi:MAG: hypothetical protein IPK63_02485 [Candidatus Competibacteraceae bacterium]|nr:hypothetical protein [Candidatus Competibacteraceae bacterium]
MTAFLSGAPVAGFACRCLEDISPAAAYKYADAVVQGQVQTVRGDINAREGSTASVAVSKAWKMSVSGEIEVLTSKSCAFAFEAETEYLLYLQILPNGTGYTTRRCAGNKPIAEARKALDWLARRGAPATLQRAAP